MILSSQVLHVRLLSNSINEIVFPAAFLGNLKEDIVTLALPKESIWPELWIIEVIADFCCVLEVD